MCLIWFSPALVSLPCQNLACRWPIYTKFRKFYKLQTKWSYLILSVHERGILLGLISIAPYGAWAVCVRAIPAINEINALREVSWQRVGKIPIEKHYRSLEEWSEDKIALQIVLVAVNSLHVVREKQSEIYCRLVRKASNIYSHVSWHFTVNQHVESKSIFWNDWCRAQCEVNEENEVIRKWA